MNPGKVVAPAGLDEHLRLGGDWAPRIHAGPVLRASRRTAGRSPRPPTGASGVGKCRQHGHRRRRDVPLLPGHHGGGTFDPGPRAAAVRDAQRSRRLAGHRRLAVHAVRDALDLCLACKGCKTDCPANVDMATYKAEFLAHHWQGRLAAPPLATSRSAGSRCWPRSWPAAGCAGVINTLTHRPGTAPGRPARRPGAARGPAVRGRDPAALVRRAGARAGRASVAPSCSGRTPSPTISTRTPARPRSPCSRTPAGGSRSLPGRCAAA